MIEFNQTLSVRDYIKTIAIHYFGYKYTYINPILGSIFILGIIILSLINPDVLNEKIFFVLAVSLFMLLKPIFYIQNIFKSIRSSKMYGNEIKIKISDEQKIITTINGNTSSINLRDLYSFYNTKNWLFLYIQRNQYLVLDKKQIPETSIHNLLDILD